MSVVSSVLSTYSSGWRINDRLASLMDSIFAIGFGLGLRFVIDAVSHHDFKLTGTLVGLWEGVILLHFLKKMPRSSDPYVAYGVRLFVDFLVTESVARLVLVLIWTGLGMVLADITPAVWDDVGLKRIWRHFRRDLYTISRMIPTVAFFPPARTVRFSPSREPSIVTDAPSVLSPSILTTEQTPVTSAVPPTPTARVTVKRRVPGFFPEDYSDTETELSSVRGRPSPDTRDPTRTSRRLSMYPPLRDFNEAASDVSSSVSPNDLDEGNISSSASSSDSTEIAGPSSAVIDTTNIPDMDLEEEALVDVTAAPVKDEGDRTPKQRPMSYMPPTPSDSAARWEINPDRDDPLLIRQQSELLPQIPDFLEESTSEDWEKIQPQDYADEKPPTPPTKDRPVGFVPIIPTPVPPQPQTTKPSDSTPSPEDDGLNNLGSQFISPPTANDTATNTTATQAPATSNAHRDSQPPPYTDDIDDIYGDEATDDKHPTQTTQPPASSSQQEHDAAKLELSLGSTPFAQLDQPTEDQIRERKEHEEQMKLKEDEEQRLKQQQEEQERRLKQEEEARKQKEDVERRQKEEEEEARKQKEVVERRQKEEEERRQKEEKEKEKIRLKEERKKKTEEEKAERLRKEAEDEAARQKKREEEAEEERKAKAVKMREDAEAKTKKEEEDKEKAKAAKLKEEVDAKIRKKEEEDKKKAEEAENRRKIAEEAEARRQKAREEDEAAAEKKRQEVEHEAAAAADRAKEEEEARQQEEARKRQEEEEKKRKQQEEEKTKQDEDEALAIETAAAAGEVQPNEEIPPNSQSEDPAVDQTNGNHHNKDLPPSPAAPPATSAPQETSTQPPYEESVVSEASEIPLKIADRLDRLLLSRAQIVEIESQIAALKEQLGAITEEAAISEKKEQLQQTEKVLRKMQRREKRRYETAGTAHEVDEKPADNSESITLEGLTPGNAKKRVQEKLEELMTPEAKSLSLTIITAKGQPGKNQKLGNTDIFNKYKLLDYTRGDKNNGRISKVYVSEEDFATWLTTYRIAATREDSDEYPW